MHLNRNIKIKTLITDIYCIIFAFTNIVYEILGQNPPDKTPRTIPRWTKPPDGQNPPVDKPPPPRQNPPRTKPPGQNHPRTKPPRTKPPGQNPPDKTPRTNPPRTKPSRTKPLGQNPPGKTPHPHKTPYKTPQTQTTTANPPRISPRSPTKHPDDKNLAKSKMAFILNSDGFRALLLINMLSGKLYVYIQLQMRYLIVSGST